MIVGEIVAANSIQLGLPIGQDDGITKRKPIACHLFHKDTTFNLSLLVSIDNGAFLSALRIVVVRLPRLIDARLEGR
ncbi:hypothetical protein BDW69DRAFT_91997 [Aspergillus filifer]